MIFEMRKEKLLSCQSHFQIVLSRQLLLSDLSIGHSHPIMCEDTLSCLSCVMTPYHVIFCESSALVLTDRVSCIYRSECASPSEFLEHQQTMIFFLFLCQIVLLGFQGLQTPQSFP